MSSEYFSHEYASNSDLKRLVNKIINGKEEPENLSVIFDQGTLNHQALTEPHKADRTDPNFPLADKMAKTVLKDDLCRRLIMMRDFRREHEFYKENVYGIKARCKTDGDSKILSTCFEYKGLAVTTDKAFEEAIYHFDYDQGAAWYLDVMDYKFVIIAGVSKKYPDRLFKRLIDRNHQMYISGQQKVIRATDQWKNFFN
jgi:hypothetical protein